MGAVRTLAGLAVAAGLFAQTGYFPLKEVRPGLRGVGRTVFHGKQVEEFQVEVLGVLQNAGPKQNLILARLSGPPLDSAGVLQGMSGSPVYIGGRLLGAVAMAFPFAKDPVTAIRPIEEMVRGGGGAPRGRARVSLIEPDLTRLIPAAWETRGEQRLVEIATPVSFCGFTAGTLELFGPRLRALGLEPRQGVTGGGAPGKDLADPSLLKPGAMITVQLMSGDMSVGADGTVTHIDGDRVYAFGHRFLSVGATDLPFARSEVLTVLPSLSTSFKISAPREWMGSIQEDRSTAVAGRLGRRAATVPLAIAVRREGGRQVSSYQMEMVNDPFLSPLLVQMAVFSALDATERTVGPSSFTVRGQIEFQGSAVPVRLDNMYAGDLNVPAQVSLGAAAPLAYALQSGFDSLKLKAVSVSVDSFPEKKQLAIDQVWLSRREVRPGEKVELMVVLAGDKGAEKILRAAYQAPPGAPVGPLHFTVADGTTTNQMEYRQWLSTAPKTAGQVVSLLNGLRGNTKAYVRVWRPDQAYQVQGEELPSPPPSVAMILARAQAGLGGSAAGRGSKLMEMELGEGNVVITGSKTVQVEVKE